MSDTDSLEKLPLSVIEETIQAEIKTGKKEKDHMDDLKQALKKENSVFDISDYKINDNMHYLVRVESSAKIALQRMDSGLADIIQQQVNVLKYYYFLFRSAIKINESARTYMEHPVECTVLNSNKDLWAFKIQHPEDECYLTSKEIKFAEVREIIKCHDANIKLLMTESSEFSFKQGLAWALQEPTSQEKEDYILLFVEFVIGLFAICKIFEYYVEGVDYVELLRKLNISQSNTPILNKLELKAELFGCDMNYWKLRKSRDHCTPQEMNVIEIQFKTVEKLLEKLPGEEEWLHYSPEFQIAKIYTLKHEKVFRNSKSKELESEIQTSLISLRKVYDMIKEKSTPSWRFLAKKILLVMLDVNMEKKEYNDSELKALDAGAKVFKEHKSFRLECKAYQCLAEAYKLVPEKCITFVKKALQVTHEISGLKGLERPLRELEAAANKKIKEKYHNKFYFLNSYPLKDQPSPMRFGGLNFEKSLKKDLMEHLVLKNKEIIVNFDVFKESVLAELLRESAGCKLLAIDFLYLAPDALILEDPPFQAKALILEEMQQKFGVTESSKVNIDILLVVSDYPQPIIEQFAELCKIPLTIYFDFKTGPVMNFNFYKEYLMRHFMYKFSLNFTNRICLGHKFELAIKNATDESIDSLINILTSNKELSVMTLKGEEMTGYFSGAKKKIVSEEISTFCKNSIRIRELEKDKYKDQILELKPGTLVEI